MQQSKLFSMMSWFIAGLTILSLSGCGSFAGFSSEPVTIRFAALEGIVDYTFFAEEFTRQHPGISIEIVPVDPTGDIYQGFESVLEEVDTARIPGMMFSEDLTTGLLPLDPLLATDRDFPETDLVMGTLPALKMDGKQFAIPAALTPYVMFYNPEKFSVRGINPPGSAWTLEDFLTAAMAVYRTDEALVGTSEYTFGFCSHPGFSDPIMFAYLFGGGILDNPSNPQALTLNLPANVESLNWYVSLRSEFGLMPPATSTRAIGEFIVRGSCGFWMDWLDRSSFGAWMQDGRPLGVLPLPAHVAEFGVSTVDGYVVAAASEHPEEAWLWIRFLLDQPGAAGQLVPPRRSQADANEYTSQAAPDVVAVARSLPSQMIILGMEMYSDPRLGAALELYSDAATKVLEGEMDAQNALDEAQRQAEQGF